MAKNISGSSLYHIPTTFLPQCLVYGIGFGVSKSHHTSTSLSDGELLPRAGRMSVCEPVLSQVGWKGFAETLENPEDQCEFSSCDSCPYHLPLGTCPFQLPWGWYAPVAWGQGPEPVMYLDMFPPPPQPPRCLGPLVPAQSCLWFGPMRLLQQLELGPGPLNWKPGLWQFLGKINLLFPLSCTHTFLGYSRFAFPIYQFPISPRRIYL